MPSTIEHKRLETPQEAQRRRSREWYWRNRERCIAAQKVWRQAHKAHTAEYRKAYFKGLSAEVKREYKHRYYLKHKETILAKAKVYASKHKAEYQAYLERNRDKIAARRNSPGAKARAKALNRARYNANTEKVKAQVRKYRATHPQFREYLRMKSEWHNRQKDEQSRQDASYYAKVRAADRSRVALKCLAEGREYRPRPSRRIPDFKVKGES